MESIIQEFSGLSNNEAYHRAFYARVMKTSRLFGLENETSITSPVVFLGNNQRELFLPLLISQFSNLPKKSAVFDVGAGAGHIWDLLNDFVSYTSSLETVTVHATEPNHLLLEGFTEKLRSFESNESKIRLGSCYNLKAENFYLNLDAYCTHTYPVEVDMVLCLHMIYFVSNPFGQIFEPENELVNLIYFLFKNVLSDKPSSSIFIVYADLENAFAGKIAQKFLESSSDPQKKTCGKRLHELYRARNSLLLEGRIVERLINLGVS